MLYARDCVSSLYFNPLLSSQRGRKGRWGWLLLLRFYSKACSLIFSLPLPSSLSSTTFHHTYFPYYCFQDRYKRDVSNLNDFSAINYVHVINNWKSRPRYLLRISCKTMYSFVRLKITVSIDDCHLKFRAFVTKVQSKKTATQRVMHNRSCLQIIHTSSLIMLFTQLFNEPYYVPNVYYSGIEYWWG